MKAEGGAANGGVHANYVAGLVDLGPSRDGMGWDGTDGWITRPPANSHNPNFTCAVEKISLVSPPSWLHPCKARSAASIGKAGGKEQQQQRLHPRWARQHQVSVVIFRASCRVQ